MFICGSGSFGHENDVENEANNSPCRTPKRTRRSTSFCKLLNRDNTNKNPFADRGLDKFYALLADLDDKKQKIYTQKGSEDISFVRFVYTNDDSDDVKPIVVRVKEKKPEKNSKSLIEQRSFKSTQSDAPDKSSLQATTSDFPKEETRDDQRVIKNRRLVIKMESLRQPQFYLVAMVVMILLFLAVYGRSFAILCTSIGWYLAPTVVGGSSSSKSSERKTKRKKISERKIVHSAGPSSPKIRLNNNRVHEQQHQQQQHHRRKKSW